MATTASPRSGSPKRVKSVASISTPGDKAETIWEACYLGDASLLRQLIRGGRSVNAENPELEFPLHLAAHANKPKIVEILLNHGALVDAIDGSRRTALHIACEHGFTEVVELLLDSNAHLGCIDTLGRTAIDIARLHEQHEVLKVFERAYDVVQCPLGCGALLQQRLVKRHLRVDCLSQLKQCPKCALEVHGYELDDHLAFRCLLTTVECPLECGEEIFRYDLVTHCYKVCANKGRVQAQLMVRLEEMPTWTRETFIEWAIPILLDAIPLHGLPYDHKAAELAAKRRSQRAALAYENRDEHGGLHDDDGRFEYGTEEHAVLALMDWAMGWMQQKQIDGTVLAQISVGAVRNLHRLQQQGRTHGWVNEAGEFVLPDWVTDNHTNMDERAKGEYSKQLQTLLQHMDLHFNPLLEPSDSTTEVLAKPISELTTQTISHTSTPADLQAAYDKVKALKQKAPQPATQIADVMTFLLAMVGMGPVARKILADKWAEITAPLVVSYLASSDAAAFSPAVNATLRRMPIAITAPEGKPTRMSEAQLREYREKYGHDAPPPLLAYNTDPTSALMYTSDFVVVGDVPVEDSSTLASLRTQVEASLTTLARTHKSSMLDDAVVVVPDPTSGAVADVNVEVWPESWDVRLHWDFMDLVRGGIVVLRDREATLHPWAAGPIILVRVHMIAVCNGRMGEARGLHSLPDPTTWKIEEK